MKRLLNILVAAILLVTCASAEVLMEDHWLEDFLQAHQEGGTGEELTLINCENITDFRMINAIETFEAETGIPVRMENIPSQQLLTRLMAGEPSVDLLFVNSDTLQDFQAAGALEPLNAYQELQVSLSGWMQVLEPGSVNGELYCVPAFLSAGRLYLHPELAAYQQQSLPTECTWSQLLAAGHAFAPERDGKGKPLACFLADNLYYPEFLRQYLSAWAVERESLADEELLTTLQLYKELEHDGLIRDQFDMEDSRGALLSVGRMIELETAGAIDMPRLGDGSEYVVGYAHGIGLSAFSQNKELAVHFLSLYAAVENQIYPEGYGFVEDIDLNPDAASLTEQEREALMRSKTYYESAKPLWQKDDFVSFLREEMEKYMRDKISLDQLIQELDRKLKMVIYG